MKGQMYADHLDHWEDDDGLCVCLDCKHTNTPCVYFIKPSGEQVVKIGATTNLASRLSSIQTSHYRHVHVETVLLWIERDQAFNEESELHKRFEDLRIRGEWFHLDGELEKMVDMLKGIRGPDVCCPCKQCDEIRNPSSPDFDRYMCMMCQSVIGEDISAVARVCGHCLDRLRSTAVTDSRVADALNTLMNNHAEPIDSGW